MTQLAIMARDNKNLFSNYYLDNQIKKNPEWKKEDHKAAFSEIKKLYDTEKDHIPTLNEKQLEQRFFAPIFKILNHTVKVNEGTEQGEFPDYAFFPDRASLYDAHKKMGNSFYNNSIAIGEVKRWGIELDRFGKDEKDRKRNPSLQIWIYLHDVTPKWGILSNGAKWRLYCKERLRDDYYEVNLPTLIATNDIENFKYFYYFFIRDAYLRSTDCTIFLDEVLKGSAVYAKVIGDDLKDNVYKAMKKVAEGFFSWSQNGLDIQNEAARKTVQKCTMLLLYRFLFLLYAEGKGLLDLKRPQYQSYSFYKLKNEVKEKHDGPLEQRYLGVGTTLWSRLKDTFRLINQGSESFGNTVGPVVDEKWKEAQANKKSFVDATLSVKVLDPAMGSGHFLVGSIEFLSEKLLLAVKKDIDNGRFSDESHLTSDWARREVVAHCIYGVDLNLMAVELAKVGLWLTTISKEKPLSFLDHRLKQGNSLIGAQLPEYRKAKALANVFTGVYFGNEVTPSQNKDSSNVYYDLFWAIMGDENEWRRKTNRDWFIKASQIASDKSFFHWELEFPDIYFEGGAPKENPGWDAVVGNPPYVMEARENAELFRELKMAPQLNEYYEKNMDMFGFFIDIGLDLTKKGCPLSFIVPSYWKDRSGAGKMRNKMFNEGQLQYIADFNDFKVFESAQGHHSSIFVIFKNPKVIRGNHLDIIVDSSLPKKMQEETVIKCLQGDGIPAKFLLSIGKLIIKKENEIDVLGKLSGINHFNLNKNQVVRGADTSPSDYDGRGVFVLTTKEYIELEKKLNIYEKELFKPFFTANQIDSYDYGLHRPKEESNFIDKNKILFVRKTKYPKFAYIPAPYFVDESVYLILGMEKSQLSLFYLLTIFNSNIAHYWFSKHKTQGGQLQIDKEIILSSPIRSISFITPPDRRAALVEQAKALYSAFLGAPVEELTNKTGIKEYCEAGFDALAGTLAKNKKKLKYSGKEKSNGL